MKKMGRQMRMEKTSTTTANRGMARREKAKRFMMIPPKSIPSAAAGRFTAPAEEWRHQLGSCLPSTSLRAGGGGSGFVDLVVVGRTHRPPPLPKAKTQGSQHLWETSASGVWLRDARSSLVCNCLLLPTSISTQVIQTCFTHVRWGCTFSTRAVAGLQERANKCRRSPRGCEAAWPSAGISGQGSHQPARGGSRSRHEFSDDFLP